MVQSSCSSMYRGMRGTAIELCLDCVFLSHIKRPNRPNRPRFLIGSQTNAAKAADIPILAGQGMSLPDTPSSSEHLFDPRKKSFARDEGEGRLDAECLKSFEEQVHRNLTTN